MRATHRTLLCLGIALCLNGTASAQSVRGVLAGTVTDSSGATIANATIEAKNHDTGVASTTVSTSVGTYRFPELPLGTYDVTVSSPGFKSSRLTGVVVEIQNVSSLDVVLQVGATSESVVVDASTPHVEIESSDLGGIVSDRQVIELPLALGGVGALRSPEAFEFLLPGTTGPGTGNSNNGIFISKISGGQNFGNEVLIDGASQTRSENGSSFDEEAPSVEALQEFKITTAMPEAEYGRTTGGIENFVTKSGTNVFHGTAFEILRNEDLDANTWFNNGFLAQCAAGDTACRARNSRPIDKKNDYGGSLGGPVFIPKVYHGKDRTFFFFSWEQLGYKLGATNTTTVPTDAMRNGDFSSPAIFRKDLAPIGTNPCDGTPVFQGQIFDPATTRVVGGVQCRTAFPGNKIDPARFSAVAKNLLSFWPAPTNTGQFNNFSFASSIPITNTATTIRIDHSFSEKSKLFGSYNSRENLRISGGNPILPDPVDPNTWKQDFTTHFFRVGWDYAFNGSLLNHLTVGSNRSNSKNFAQAIFAGVNWSKQVGIGNAVSNNFPQITVGEQIDNLGNPPQNDDNVDNGLRLYDSIAWIHGRHSLKFGVDYRWQQYSPINGNSPTFNFCRAQTAADPAETGLAGNGLASLLLGDTCNAGQNIVTSQPRWTSHYIAGFVQDDFKATRNLTLNLGLRYDVDKPRHEAHNQTSNLSLTATDPEFGIPGALVFGSTCGGCNTAWADTYWKEFAPRIGFAYSPFKDGKTVVRGGYSIFYGPLQYADFGGAMNTGYKANPSKPSPDGFSPSFQIDSGFPTFTPPPNLDPGIFNGTFVGGAFIGKDQGRPAMVNEWTLNVQRELGNDLILSVGYLGNRAQNLRSGVQNINNIPVADIALGDQLFQPVTNNTAGVSPPFAGFTALWNPGQVQQALRPFPQYGFIATDCCLQNVGMSSYEALLVSLERRFRNGLNLQVSYTWSKTLTDADSALPGINAGVNQEQNPANLHQEKAISSQDIPQTLVLSWIYQLPFGPGRKWMKSGFASYIIGGWEIGGVQRYQSGEPISFGCASGIPGWDNCIRFTRVNGQSLKSAAYASGNLDVFGGQGIFNPAAFVDLNLPSVRNGGAFTFGNMPRVTGEIRNFPYYNEDFAITKNVQIRERLTFSLKFELLNAFNRHVFGIPDTEPNDGSNFGHPTFTIDSPRNVQVTGRIFF
jgi:Carboxypeptidase regulatory-like domain/TonB dependent receptor